MEMPGSQNDIRAGNQFAYFDHLREQSPVLIQYGQGNLRQRFFLGVREGSFVPFTVNVNVIFGGEGWHPDNLSAVLDRAIHCVGTNTSARVIQDQATVETDRRTFADVLFKEVDRPTGHGVLVFHHQASHPHGKSLLDCLGMIERARHQAGTTMNMQVYCSLKKLCYLVHWTPPLTR